MKLIPNMQKNLKKVHFLKKFCQENHYRVTQPLNFFVQKICLDVYMIGHKLKKNCSIRFENSFCQFSNFEAQKRTLLAFAGWCHKNQLTFMHKTSILDRCVCFNPFHLAFRFYTVKSPKISVVLANILVWLLNNPKLRLFPLLMIKKHSIFWFWSDSETEVFSTRFSLCTAKHKNGTATWQQVLQCRTFLPDTIYLYKLYEILLP